MRDIQINTVQSRALTAGEFLDAIRRLDAHSSKGDFDTYATSEAHACPLLLHKLPELNAFERISSTFGVTVITKKHQADCGAVFQSFTRRTHDLSLSHAWTTWYACESRMALDANKQDLSILAGLRKEGYFAGVHIFHPSPAMSNIASRKELFDLAITTMDVPDNVSTQIGDDVLYMRAGLPWKLVYPSYQVPGGGNPLGVFVCGFSGIEDAISAGERLVKRFAKKLVGVGFVAKLTGQGYDSAFRELSAHNYPWSINVMGELSSEAIDILNGASVSNSSLSRIPAFVWYHRKDHRAYGSVVIENGNRYLEIATDRGTLKQLQERVAFLEDLRFRPVDPN